MGKEYASPRELYDDLGIADASPETKMEAVREYLGADKVFIEPGQGSKPLAMMEQFMDNPALRADYNKFLVRTERNKPQKQKTT